MIQYKGLVVRIYPETVIETRGGITFTTDQKVGELEVGSNVTFKFDPITEGIKDLRKDGKLEVLDWRDFDPLCCRGRGCVDSMFLLPDL